MSPAQIILSRLDELTARIDWPLVRTGDLRRAVERDGVPGDLFDATMHVLEAQRRIALFARSPGDGQRSHVALSALV